MYKSKDSWYLQRGRSLILKICDRGDSANGCEASRQGLGYFPLFGEDNQNITESLLVYPDSCMFNRSFPQSKVCFIGTGDLKKSNKRKQAPSDESLLPACCAIYSCWASAVNKKSFHVGFILPVISSQTTLSSGWWGYRPPCHPWESWKFNSSLPLWAVWFSLPLSMPLFSPQTMCIKPEKESFWDSKLLTFVIQFPKLYI